jgi:adiponectin receptor
MHDLVNVPKRFRRSPAHEAHEAHEAHKANRWLPPSIYKLEEIEEIPEYLKEDNPFIRSMYRREFVPSWANCMRSAFSWHNETVNIWSHALATLMFSALWMTPNNTPKVWNGIPFDIFMAAACNVLFVSTVVHLLCCTSKTMNRFVWKMDYIAVLGVITSTFVSACPYVFWCEPVWLTWSYISVALLIALGCCVCVIDNAFQSPAIRTRRLCMFALLPAWGLVPIIHAALVLGQNDRVFTLLLEIGATIAILVFGGAILLFRIPERWAPGHFDLILNSHNLWHIAMVAALFSFRLALLEAQRWAIEQRDGCCACQRNEYFDFTR